MADVSIYEGSSTNEIRVPYFCISVGKKYSLTPVPPRYIKSVNVKRLKNQTSAEYSINIVAPISAFSTGSDDLTLILTSIISQSDTGEVDGEKYNKIDFIYGWRNGAQTRVSEALVTTFKFDYVEDNQFINYTIGGVCSNIYPNVFSTAIYSSQNEKIGDSNDMLGTITEFYEGGTQLSIIIEKLAKYIFPDYTVSVEHTDKSYDISTDIHTVLGLSTKLDGAKVTMFEYLKMLVNGCRVWEPSSTSQIESNTGKYFGDLPVVTLNGKTYTLNTNEKINDKSIINMLTYNPSGSSEYVYPFESLTADNIAHRVYAESPNNSRRAGKETGVGVYLDGKLVYLSLIDSSNSNITNKPKSFVEGSYGNQYKLRIDPFKKILRVSSSITSGPKVYNISNNRFNDEVISFSVSSDGIAAISGAMAVTKDNEITLDVDSGGTVVSNNNMGGLVAITENKTKQLEKYYVNTIAERISTYTSEAQMTLIGSASTVNADIVDTCIRVLPTINGGETFWCGDYMIDSIEDTVNSDGFETKYVLSFGKSKFMESFDEKVNNAGTDQ